MVRRKGRSSGLKVRVSYEATRLSQTRVAAAFDLLVPAIERRTVTAQVPPTDDYQARASQNTKPMRGG